MSSFKFPSERSGSYNPKYYQDNGASEVTQAELDLKSNRANDTLINPTLQNANFLGTATGLTVSKASVGLGNVDNTSDANKPISTATATALASKLGNTNQILGYTNIGSTSYPWYQSSSVFGAVTSNLTGGHAELDFVNSGTATGPAASTSAFDWYLATSASTRSLLMRLFLNGALSVPGSIVSPTITAITANVAALQTGKADTTALDAKLDKNQGVHGPWTYFSSNAATDSQHFDDATIVGGLTGCLVPGSSDFSFVQTGNNTAASSTAFSFQKATSVNTYTKLASITNTGDFAAQGTVTGTNITSMASDIASKASQTSLTATNTTVSGLTTGLASTNTTVALKANQTALDTTNATVALKANQTALDATNATVATKITNVNQTYGVSNYASTAYPWYQHATVFGALIGNSTGGNGELAFWNSGSVSGPTVAAFDWNLATSGTTRTNLMRLLQNGNLTVPGTITATNITSLTSTVAGLSSLVPMTKISVTADTTLTLAQVTNTCVYVVVSDNDVVITLPDLSAPFVGEFRVIFDRTTTTNTGTCTLHHPTSAKLRSPGWIGSLQDVTLSARDNVQISMYDTSYFLSKAPAGYRLYKDLTVAVDTILAGTDICETMVVMLTATAKTITFPNPSSMAIGTRFNVKFLENTGVTPTYTATLAIDQTTNAYWRLNNATAANFKTTLTVSSGAYIECVKWSANTYVVLSTV